jgi:hypothetical protein
MRKTRPRTEKPSRARTTTDDEAEQNDAKRQRTKAEEVHDAGRPGGLPAVDAKTDWEAEHDTWWRHE